MSSEALTSATAGMGAGEASVVQRVQQLQAMIEQARQVAFGAPPAAAVPAAQGTAPTSFASTLRAATASVGPPATGTASGGESGPYDALVNQAAQRYGLDPAVLHGLIQQESGFDPSARSSAGAAGLTQLMPGTASSMGVTDPLNPAESIEGGARYLSQMMTQFGGNTTDALAAYNAGPGAVQQYGGVPPYAETQSHSAAAAGALA